MNLKHLFIEGGFIMWPLLACSLIIWIVFLEKVWFLWHFKSKFKQFHNKIYQLVKNKEIDQIDHLFINSDKLITTPYMAIINKDGLDKDIQVQKITRKIKETQTGLKRYLWLLGTIASASPFIGLFGTVIGIIKSFQSIADAGKGGFAVVASGLSEALIATAAGIIVAVIAVIFFNYFQSRLTLMNEDYKHKLEDFFELVSGSK